MTYIKPPLILHTLICKSSNILFAFERESDLSQLVDLEIRFEYEVYNSQGELLNTGMTALGFLHADTHRPTRAPQWFVEALAAAMK